VAKKKTAKKAAKSRAKPVLKAVDAPPAKMTYRERQKLLMRRIRRSEQGVAIRPCADRRRRTNCEKDVFLWLRTYLGHKFYHPFTKHHEAMISAVLHRARHGGDQAIAAPRGEGKTSIVEGVLLFAVLTGVLAFPVAVGATREHAQEIIDNVKHELEHNDVLAADYPEVCDPIWALEGESRRAAKQNVDGTPTAIKWQKSLIVLPTVEGSVCSGAIFAARGLHGRIRGMKHLTTRPDFVLVDDPETDDSARNPKQVKKRMDKIDRELAGLGGPGKSIARVALVTIQVAQSLADRLTNPKICPTWNGMRFPLVERMPDREDLVQEYIRLYKEGQSTGDEDGRKALAFYKRHRKEIEKGSKVANPHRYVTKPGKDGKPLEITTLQHALNWIARIGLDAFQAEFQNDPPPDTAPETLGITPELVADRQCDFDRCLAPRDRVALVAHLDLGKSRCHYTTTAWMAGRAGLVIDYDRFDVLEVPGAHHDDAVKKSIYNALIHWRTMLLDSPYHDERGEVADVDLAVVDAGDWHDVVYKFIRDVGGAPFIAAKGFGESSGTAPWKPGKDSKTRIVGNHWWISYQAEYSIWLYGFDADFWKLQVHRGFLTPTFNDDRELRDLSLSIFRQEHLHQHLTLASHVTAEEWREQFVPEVGWKKMWVKLRRDNHWFDNLANCSFAHDVWLTRMAGKKPTAQTPTITTVPDEERNVFRTPSGMPYLLTERES